MVLEITKHLDKPHVISYWRDNDTKTWMYADDFFVRHDLSHYAIESKLGYTSAFMGMLNNGIDIQDFADREKKNKMIVSKQARYSEGMANLFLIEIEQGEIENFNDVMKEIFEISDDKLDAPVLSEDELVGIRTCLRQLYKAWSELPVNETMSLPIKL